VAVANPSVDTDQTTRIVLAAGIAVVVLLAALLWGPVARGLHEESVERWCTWAQASPAASLQVEISGVDSCVDIALHDPAFLTALRASL